MSASTNDLRDHLIAAIEAAPELPSDDRRHLADVFLSELESRYRLVPRRPGNGLGDASAGVWLSLQQALMRVWPLVLLGIAALIAVPLLLFPFYLLFHIPFLVPILVFLVILRVTRGGWGRRQRMHW